MVVHGARRDCSRASLKNKKGSIDPLLFFQLARPEGFEPPTPWFVAKYSIQMSYGRVFSCLAEREGFEPSMGF